MIEDELVLHGEPSDVPTARRHVHERLVAWGRQDVADEAELVASELVTNGLLHAGAPVRLTLRAHDHAVRLEVHDPSRLPPVRPGAAAGEGMTGRGLALVAALSTRWGVEPAPDGKSVWAEICAAGAPTEPAEPEDVDVDALLAAFDDEWPHDATVPRFTVTLGDVPTDLLLEAKAHVDALTREFTLAASGAATGMAAAVPAHLAALVESVVSDFAEARQTIKRQAFEAAAEGRARTTLTLTLPADAADAGERYLAALEEADGYARAARLLTLEAPPRHRAFRRWYVSGVVDALRAAAAGRPAPAPESFEDCLLREVDSLAALQRMSDRAVRLHRITAALGDARDAADVGEIVLREAALELGARRGSLVLRRGDDYEVAGTVGYSEPMLAALRAAEVAGALPGTVAIATGAPVWVESREERDRRFPQLAAVEPDTLAACALPLLGGDGPLGAIRFSFAEPRLFDADERGFLSALAATAGQTVDRAAVYERQAVVADRLRRLQAVNAVLTATRDVAGAAEAVVAQAAGSVGAALSALCLLAPDGHTLELVRDQAVHPEQRVRWHRFDVDDALPAAEAVRTGRPVVVTSKAERDARWPQLAGLPPHDEHTLVCLPLRVDRGVLGVLAMSFTAPHRVDRDELEYLVALADAAAQAIDRAHALDEASRANGRLLDLNAHLTTMAHASDLLAGNSLSFDDTLSALGRILVPDLADWCAVHLADPAGVRRLSVVHRDPDALPELEALLSRLPVGPDAEFGAGAVIRSGLPQELPAIGPEVLAAAARGDDGLLAELQALPLGSALVVPLRGRVGTVGAVTMVREKPDPYSDRERALARDVCTRAGLAIENAEVHEQARRALAERDAVLAQLPVAVVVVDVPSGRIRLSNAAAEELWQGPLDASRSVFAPVSMELLRPDGTPFPPDLTPVHRALRLGEVVRSEQVDIRWRNGEMSHWVVNAGPVRDESGRIVAGVLAFDDVTGEVESARRRGELADALQASLLPPVDPVVPGLQMAAVYVPVSDDLLLGGDFYDVFETTGKAWGVVIGDVEGKGAEAAGVTALARYTLRAAAMGARRPDVVLGQLNEALLRDERSRPFLTAAYLLVHPVGPHGADVELALAGHPQPYLVHQDGSVQPVGTPGDLLGVLDDAAVTTEQLRLTPGQSLVLYTDGLIDAGAGASRLEDAGVRALLADTAGRPVEVVARTLADAARAKADGRARDDLALLVLRVPPAG